MFKFADDVENLIADALQKTRVSMSLTPPGQNPVFDVLNKALGRQYSPVEQGIGKGYGENIGKVWAAQEVGAPKFHMLLKHLPTLAAVGGGAILVKKLYDYWQRNKVMESLQSDPDLNMIDEKKRKDALNMLQRYAPSLATDPYASKALVKRIAAYDDITAQDLNTLMEAQKKYHESVGAGSYFSPITSILSTIIG